MRLGTLILEFHISIIIRDSFTKDFPLIVEIPELDSGTEFDSKLIRKIEIAASVNALPFDESLLLAF